MSFLFSFSEFILRYVEVFIFVLLVGIIALSLVYFILRWILPACYSFFQGFRQNLDLNSKKWEKIKERVHREKVKVKVKVLDGLKVLKRLEKEEKPVFLDPRNYGEAHKKSLKEEPFSGSVPFSGRMKLLLHESLTPSRLQWLLRREEGNLKKFNWHLKREVSFVSNRCLFTLRY